MSPPVVRACIALLLVVVVAACGGPGRTGVDDPLPSVLEVTANPGRDGSASPDGPAPASPPLASPSPAPATPPGRTDTEWGRIWNTLPEDFPRFPGAVPSDSATSADAASAVLSAPEGDPATVAEWLQTELELATYSTEALSGPLDDGGFVLDSVGDDGCRIETTVTPAGDATVVTVRYGASCPFD